MTRDVPGLLVRSVFPDADGQPVLSAGTFLTTHESPLSERWGGWYVTGTRASAAHGQHALDEKPTARRRSRSPRRAGERSTDLTPAASTPTHTSPRTATSSP